jgi:predicted ribosomally synthesized peptide with nif11-like leader
VSKQDIDRFVGDLTSDADLRNELSGSASGVGSVVAFAKAKGYDIDAGEVRAFLDGQAGKNLTDDQLEAIAGGKGHHHHHHSHSTTTVTQTNTVQTAEVATTAAAAAEVAAVAVVVVT